MAAADVSLSPESLGNTVELHVNLKNFFDNAVYTDAEFELKYGGESVRLKAHKLPLAIWSPYFADLFYGRNGSPQGPVSITDVTPNVFSVMLNFVYGSVCELSSRRQDVDFLLKLYKAASRYQIEALQSICVQNIREIAPDIYNVFVLLDAADMMEDDDIRSNCIHLLQTRTAEVLNYHHDLCLERMILVLDLERVSFPSEYDLVMWAFAWAMRKHADSDKKRSFRSILDDILGHVDLTIMEAEQFNKVLSNYENVFSDSECVKIFRSIANAGCCDLPDWASASIDRKYSYRG